MTYIAEVCRLTHPISPISLFFLWLRSYFRSGRADRGNRKWTGAPPCFASRIGTAASAIFTRARTAWEGRSRPNNPCGLFP